MLKLWRSILNVTIVEDEEYKCKFQVYTGKVVIDVQEKGLSTHVLLDL